MLNPDPNSSSQPSPCPSLPTVTPPHPLSVGSRPPPPLHCRHHPPPPQRYAYWLWDFWLNTPDGKKWSLNGWNCFDFIVVAIGWMLQLNVALPGPLKLLRLMRAFRVFRLFKRVKSLNKIIVSLGKAVPGMSK